MNVLKKTPLIIDTDPGIDDALALILLSENLDKFDVKLITSCCGNTSIEITTTNVRFLAEKLFPGVKVAKGSDFPLVKRFSFDASNVHGQNGLGNYEIGKQTYPYFLNGIEEMKNVLLESQEPVIIVTLGPLTNIAKLFISYPEVKDKIKCIYSMIGSIYGKGNLTLYAEFNSYIDPEAFDIVSKFGVPMILNPMEIGNETQIDKKVFEKIEAKTERDNFIKTMVENIHETLGEDIICLYDPNSIVALVRPDLYDFIPCNITVNTEIEIAGKSMLTENKKSIHKYQKPHNPKEVADYVLKVLFNR